MKVARLWAVLLVLFVIAAIPSVAAPLAGPCAAGAAYDPACDVNHDGAVNVLDIQLTAGHWNQTGTYNIYPAMLRKTGQTTCYSAAGTVIACPGTGQDGDWQRGVAWPNPRFTDNSNGTVTDNLTGLIWLKNANCYGTRDWATALMDANTLNSGECGLTDGSVEGNWRLPNLLEMLSLQDYERFDPALPSGHPFTVVNPNTVYSTSTTQASGTSFVWSMHLYNGYVTAFAKSVLLYVWPVRGGQ